MQAYSSCIGRLITISLALTAHLVSAALLPASTLLTRPHQVAHTSAQALPEITRRATLDSRVAAAVISICGYWSDNVSTYTISCEPNIPCLFTNIDPTAAVGYCSNGSPPITAVFDYGSCPTQGAQNGQLCCSSAAPSFGVYLFNNGSSGFLTCGATSFSINATTMLAAPVNSSATTTSSSPQPTQTGGNNNTNAPPLKKWTTVGIVVGVLAGIVTIIAGPLAVLKWLRGRRPEPRPEPVSGPHNFHFHEPVHLHNCVFQQVGAGNESSATRLLSAPPHGLLSGSRVQALEGP